MNAPQPLSEEDLVAARGELAAGKPFPVWFTAAAVGVPAGGSAKVVAVDDVAEGDFIQVKPAGSRDTMFCSPNELTRTRPPRKRAQQAPVPPAAQPVRRVADDRAQNDGAQNDRAQNDRAQKPAPAVRSTPVADPTPVAEPPARRPAAAAARRAARSAVQPVEPAPEPPARPAAPATGTERPRAAGGRAAARPAEVTVVLSSTAEGAWTVEATVGKKRTVRPTPVQPADVAKAARSLPPAVLEAIESSLAAARQQQAERVERLRAELDAAQRALQELNG